MCMCLVLSVQVLIYYWLMVAKPICVALYVSYMYKAIGCHCTISKQILYFRETIFTCMVIYLQLYYVVTMHEINWVIAGDLASHKFYNLTSV